MKQLSWMVIVSGNYFNHVVYADDTLLLASPIALQKLRDTCCHYFTSHRLVINYQKCKGMTVCPKCLKSVDWREIFMKQSVGKCKQIYF